MAFDPIRITARNPSPMTGEGNNTYLLAEPGREATLIDAGVGAAAHLSEIQEHLSRQRSRLTTVLVTHAHADHALGAATLRAAHPLVRFRKFPWRGEDERYPVEWTPIDEGDEISAGGEPLVVLRTPGHSPDHLAFWHRSSRTVFTGDLIVQGSSVMIQASRGGNLGQYLAALERLLALGPARLLPAHGPEITSPDKLLRAYLDHRAMRERQVIAALAGGHDTVQAIAECIYDGLDAALMPAARENVRAHLDKLKEEDQALEANGSWTLAHGA